jgi:hypothetical protein
LSGLVEEWHRSEHLYHRARDQVPVISQFRRHKRLKLKIVLDSVSFVPGHPCPVGVLLNLHQPKICQFAPTGLASSTVDLKVWSILTSFSSPKT